MTPILLTIFAALASIAAVAFGLIYLFGWMLEDEVTE